MEMKRVSRLGAGAAVGDHGSARTTEMSRSPTAATKYPAVVWVILVLLVPLARGADLGERILWNVAEAPLDSWKTATNITATVESGTLVVRSGEADYGWAASERRAPLLPNSRLDIEVLDVANGQLGVQVEWFKQDGSFIGFTNVLSQVKSADKVSALDLASLVPKDPKPKQFGLKFWIEGRHAAARVTKAEVRFTRQFRNPDTRLLHRYDADSTIKPEDGVTLSPDGKTIVAALTAGKEYAAILLEERAAFDAKGVVLLDLASIHGGGLSVQAVCWNAEGTYLKSVDLIKDATASGLVEVGFKLYADQFSPGTTQVSFKIWLAGKETTARMAGLFYGIAP